MLGEQDVMRGLMSELNRRLRPSWSPLPHQVPPTGRWRGWILLGGRGSGKTDACTSYVNDHAMGPPCLNGPAPHWIGIIAPTLGDAVTSCVNGPAGIIAHNPTARLVSSPGGMIVRWPNGAEAKLFGASSPDDVERLRSGGNRCLVAGTLVRTVRGQVPIEQVTTEDLVYTRNGLRRVLASRQTGVERIWKLTTVAGHEIRGTGNHALPTGRGDVELQFLSQGDSVTAWPNLSHTTVSDGVAAIPKTTTGILAEAFFTDTFGSHVSDRFRPECTCIINTRMIGTQQTSAGYSCLLPKSTQQSTQVATSQRAIHVLEKLLGNSANPSNVSANGAEINSHQCQCQPRADDSVRRNVETSSTKRRVTSSRVGHTRYGCALCAVRSSLRQSEKTPRLVTTPVEPYTSRLNGSSDKDAEKFKRSASVRSAAVSSGSTAIDHPRPIQDRVQNVSVTSDVAPVYDLLIEHDHEFFANNILVWNCLVMAEELAAWRHLDDAWAHMKFGLRAGPHPHWVGATTPKPRQLIKKLNKGEERGVIVSHATTNDNPHLLLDVREELFDTYGGTALGQQELEGRIIDQDPSALWRREHIELGRLAEAPPSMKKISVGVDPSGGAGEQGIVVVGRTDMPTIIPGIDGARLRPHGFVLADRTCHLSPNGWGREAVVAALDYEADDIVVEVNYGGEMATSVVRGAAEALGIPISIKQVRASRGKRVRAEPVAALSEPARQQWHHVGVFEELEDQLATWTLDLDWSPDRLDAMVWPAWHMALVGPRRTGVRGSFAGRDAAATVLDAS